MSFRFKRLPESMCSNLIWRFPLFNFILLIKGKKKQSRTLSYFLFSLLTLFFSCTTEKKPIAFMDPYPKPVFEQISDTITRNLKQNIKRIIVLTFINQDGKEHKLGSVFAEKLTTELVKQNKLIVLDRMVFKSKLQEKSLTLVGNPDLSYLKQVGDILGVDAVLIGIVNPYASGYDLNCRLIDIKTGLILSAEEGYYSEKSD